MKELLVVSGKGGTGKTTIVGTLAVLAKDTPLIRNPVLADCDVDAADLHLILNPATKESKEFFGLKKAGLDRDKCDNCGECIPVCRFDAITSHNGIIRLDPISCEGCGAVSYTHLDVYKRQGCKSPKPVRTEEYTDCPRSHRPC